MRNGMQKILLTYILVTSAPLNGQAADKQLEVSFAQIAAATRFSLIDGGGSKGMYGTTVGVGVTEVTLAKPNSVTNQILGQSTRADATEAPQRWLRVSAVRGTSWPIDLGVSVSQLQGTTTSQISGILQVTLYEDFAWPAVSVRGHHSQILGLRSSTITSNALELVVTKGIWRYFTGYFAAGGDHVDLSLTLRNHETLALNEDGEIVQSRTVQGNYVKGGLQITAWPPFLNLYAEGMIDRDQSQSLSLKLNWLI